MRESGLDGLIVSSPQKRSRTFAEVDHRQIRIKTLIVIGEIHGFVRCDRTVFLTLIYPTEKVFARELSRIRDCSSCYGNDEEVSKIGLLPCKAAALSKIFK